jgi:hypothetical protein
LRHFSPPVAPLLILAQSDERSQLTVGDGSLEASAQLLKPQVKYVVSLLEHPPVRQILARCPEHTPRETEDSGPTEAHPLTVCEATLNAAAH